ncbi:MAG: hypothetical protein Q8M58_09790 [Anaerolineales bacterium]|nr:hypothetical protein [Anaerolineales bacterium]
MPSRKFADAATAVQEISAPTVTARACTLAVEQTPQSAAQFAQFSAISHCPLGHGGGTGVGPPGAVVGVDPGPQQP